MKWKYYRLSDHRVSKWVLRNNWVTKRDRDTWCVIGINGRQQTNILIATPKHARRYVEAALK